MTGRIYHIWSELSNMAFILDKTLFPIYEFDIPSFIDRGREEML